MQPFYFIVCLCLGLKSSDSRIPEKYLHKKISDSKYVYYHHNSPLLYITETNPEDTNGLHKKIAWVDFFIHQMFSRLDFLNQEMMKFRANKACDDPLFIKAVDEDDMFKASTRSGDYMDFIFFYNEDSLWVTQKYLRAITGENKNFLERICVDARNIGFSGSMPFYRLYNLKNFDESYLQADGRRKTRSISSFQRDKRQDDFNDKNDSNLSETVKIQAHMINIPSEKARADPSSRLMAPTIHKNDSFNGLLQYKMNPKEEMELDILQ